MSIQTHTGQGAVSRPDAVPFPAPPTAPRRRPRRRSRHRPEWEETPGVVVLADRDAYEAKDRAAKSSSDTGAAPPQQPCEEWAASAGPG